MPAFIAFLFVQILLALGLLGNSWNWSAAGFKSFDNNLWASVALVLIPSCLFWLAADTLQRFSRRKHLDIRRRRSVNESFSLGALGAFFGVLHIALAGAGMGLWQRAEPNRLPESLVLAASAALCGLFVTLVLPRVKAGSCVQCGYDTAGIANTARCPECGTSGALAHVPATPPSGAPAMSPTHTRVETSQAA